MKIIVEFPIKIAICTFKTFESSICYKRKWTQIISMVYLLDTFQITAASRTASRSSLDSLSKRSCQQFFVSCHQQIRNMSEEVKAQAGRPEGIPTIHGKNPRRHFFMCIVALNFVYRRPILPKRSAAAPKKSIAAPKKVRCHPKK